MLSQYYFKISRLEKINNDNPFEMKYEHLNISRDKFTENWILQCDKGQHKSLSYSDQCVNVE